MLNGIRQSISCSNNLTGKETTTLVSHNSIDQSKRGVGGGGGGSGGGGGGGGRGGGGEGE